MLRRLLPTVERWMAKLVREGAPRPSSRRSILVLKLDAIGDFVLASAFLRELRHGVPAAHITLCTGSAASPLAKVCPYVDEHRVLNVSEGPRRFAAIRRLLEYRRHIRELFRDSRFDTVLVPRTGPDLHHAHLLAYLTGAPVRVGFGPGGGNYLTIPVLRPDASVHEVQANLSLLRVLGITPQSDALELWYSSADQGRLDKLLVDESVRDGSRLIVLGVGASLAHKIWPTERFEALARHLIEMHGVQVIAIGDSGDAARYRPSANQWHNWAGRLTLGESGALLRRADLFVGNDSAGVHLASAARCPVVVVSWDHEATEQGDVNSHLRFAPYQVPYRTIHPSSRSVRSVASVPLQAVVAAVEDILQALPRKPTAP